MEAESPFKVSLTIYQFTWCHIPEDMNLHKCQCQNLKSCRNIPVPVGIMLGCVAHRESLTG